ncbi:hypothetical protein [Mesorhizobium sp.]|uniref:hypothetical protein n=1 Tax=Mesorhizobium sp. TaxID=1871066 RepID=UPI00121A4ED9|nr:hypothetical protein [Mesorhizobium sp.]TIL49603.1 MAG: hypothetical protein E5Y83_25600 [Mesorhizobium sp.]TIL84558.1 MAG: hypothetical protein E5Y73_32795 [Mesorhizobium sp.]
MARRKDYWENIATQIAEVVAAREIEDVLHFTRLENLPGILEHGLRTRPELVNADFEVYASDADRLDEEDDAVSVSISCYYPRMLEAKRYRAGSWPSDFFCRRRIEGGLASSLANRLAGGRFAD